MAFDLPIDDVTTYVEDLLNQIGENCTIDGVSTKIMISDLQKAYSNLEQNSKQAVISNKITVTRGTLINFANGKVAIVYTMPNNDIVSFSMRILMTNASVHIFRYEEVYDETNGDILASGENSKGQVVGFIERVDAMEKRYDVGILHETVLRFVTSTSSDIQLDDLVDFKNKRYRVIDIDDITEGLHVIQLASVRK